jgi:hypothetical protein
MKKLLSIMSIMYLFYLTGNTQPVLEYTGKQSQILQLWRFTTAGDKYVSANYHNYHNDSLITIYNLDYSVYKTIIIPQISLRQNPQFDNISDNLINIDSKIEYAVIYPSSGSYGDYVIYNEDGINIFQRDSVVSFNSMSISNNEMRRFYKTSQGWKMCFSRANNQEIYSLPGSLPIVTNLTLPINKSSILSNPYPNPTDGETKIDFKLPNDVKQGEITVFNEEGEKIKSFMIDNTFGTLLLNYSGLPSGTYYYIMKAGEVSDSKKMIVIP